MKWTGNIIRTCRDCGQPISTRQALTYRLGSDCIRGKTPEELEEARKLTEQEADPFYTPPDKAPSFEARINHGNAAAAAVGGTELCRPHGSPVGKCALCRRDRDPARAAERILGEIRKMTRTERREERLAALDGRFERWSSALAARPRPAPKPKPEPEKKPRPAAARKPKPPPPGQMTFC